MELRKKLKFFLIIGIIIINGGCSNPPLFNKIYSFKNAKWEQNVKPQFTFKIDDISKEYQFSVTIRTTTDYKYSNLWMYMNTKTPNGIESREPFKMEIAYPDGEWIGKKTGTIVEHVLYFKNRKLPQKGTYTFIIEQGVTQSEIDEILDLSLTVDTQIKSLD